MGNNGIDEVSAYDPSEHLSKVLSESANEMASYLEEISRKRDQAAAAVAECDQDLARGKNVLDRLNKARETLEGDCTPAEKIATNQAGARYPLPEAMARRGQR